MFNNNSNWLTKVLRYTKFDKLEIKIFISIKLNSGYLFKKS